jgi:aryl sulfotransferase
LPATADESAFPGDGWTDFEFRHGDIVIATNPKSGTTWMQTICALLIFQTPELLAPLPELSPWLDHWVHECRLEIRAQLAVQQHRRFVKTHTSLSEIPLNPQVTYIVVARHPLDARISKSYHMRNLDQEQLRSMEGHSGQGDGPRKRSHPSSTPRRRSPSAALLPWIDRENGVDSLPRAMYFLCDAWQHRNKPNVVLVHYDDLCADLASEMRRLSKVLGILVPDQIWPELVEAASFEQMRSRASRLIPDPELFKDAEAFFRRGKSGAWRDFLTDKEYSHYLARVAELAPPDLNAWLHRQHVD